MKALSDSISKRISNISSDKATFNNAAPFYNHLLSASGYKENLTYQKDLPPSIKVKPRKIIWLNPPYSVNVETNFDREILTQTLLTKRYLSSRKKLFSQGTDLPMELEREYHR